VATVSVGDHVRGARRARLRPVLHRCAAEAAAIAEPAELEAYGFRMLATPTLAGAPRALIEDAVAEIAAARRGRALLEAMAAAAVPPASSLAAAAALRLRATGARRGLAAAGVGSLTPMRAWSVAGAPETGVAVACRRPGDPRAQMLAFAVGPPQSGAALLVDGAVTPPIDDPALLTGGPGAVGVEEISTGSAVARVHRAARATLAADIAPTLEAVQALVLLLRAARVPGAGPLLAALHARALTGPVAASAAEAPVALAATGASG
jgi:hypothetical protein